MSNPTVNILNERMDNLIKENSKEHRNILSKIEGIDDKLDKAFVTKTEFKPVKALVYGLVTMILVAFFTAIIRLVIIQLS